MARSLSHGSHSILEKVQTDNYVVIILQVSEETKMSGKGVANDSHNFFSYVHKCLYMYVNLQYKMWKPEDDVQCHSSDNINLTSLFLYLFLRHDVLLAKNSPR